MAAVYLKNNNKLTQRITKTIIRIIRGKTELWYEPNNTLMMSENK